mmetsp:Transcript_17542/g.37931  ORF Transcript_17542/g.37931 Transcript_17542/m.37931 type:complete len:162 (-) Transcript_17542:468-953(-)
MGDGAVHGAEARDCRVALGTRPAATAYVADISEENSRKIAEQTLAQIFPLPPSTWLEARAARYLAADGYTYGVERKSVAEDKGRKPFQHCDPARTTESSPSCLRKTRPPLSASSPPAAQMTLGPILHPRMTTRTSPSASALPPGMNDARPSLVPEESETSA